MPAKVISTSWIEREVKGLNLGDERLNRRMGNLLEMICPNRNGHLS